MVVGTALGVNVNWHPRFVTMGCDVLGRSSVYVGGHFVLRELRSFLFVCYIDTEIPPDISDFSTGSE